MNQPINFHIGESMATTQMRIARAIRSASEDLASDADSLQTAANIVAIDLDDNLGEPKRLNEKIERVKLSYARLLKALEGYEAP